MQPDQPSHPHPQALEAAYLFYEAQRSGQLPPSNRVPWRSSAHKGDLVPGGWCEWPRAVLLMAGCGVAQRSLSSAVPACSLRPSNLL